MPTRRSLLWFIVFVFVFSTPFYLWLNLAGGRGEGMRLYVTGLMWCPALAALLACHLGGTPLAALGWRWPGARIQWAAYLLPLGYSLLVYGVAWSSGLGAFSSADYAAYAMKSLGLPAWPAWAHVALMVALQASAGFAISCASALGEEIGWRGLLAPALCARFGFTRGSVATGLLWALWHVPVLFWMNFDGATPRAYAITCFTLSLVGMSVVYSWFRLRTGSLWPAVFLHASHNAFLTTVFSMLTADTGRTAYAIDEFGFLLVLAVALLAFAFWHRRALLPTA
jgi:membrane protease YdiL (CAAX protease family)